MKTLATIVSALIAIQCLGVPFQNLKFNTDIDTNAVNAINGKVVVSNDTFAINSEGKEIPSSVMSGVNGITFEVRDEGEIRFVVQEEFFPGQQMGSALDRITINGKSLLATINEVVDAKLSTVSPRGVTNTIQSMVYNPLWGKKLAVIGDSLACTPRGESYCDLIAARNNMTLFHHARGGEKICRPVTNALGNVSVPSLLSTYTNDIPVDADFIICQIGSNDVGDMWRTEQGWTVDDTDMSTNTFKGCFNTMLITLKKTYPNAKVGIVLPHNWVENLGQKSEDMTSTESNGSKKQMSQWQKVQCQKLNIPVFDPQEDTRMIPWYNSVIYTNGTTVTSQGIADEALDWYERTKRDIGTSQWQYNSNYGQWNIQSTYFWDTHHFSTKGNIIMSFFYENWMKTVLMAN